MIRMINGGCLCGKNSYEIKGVIFDVMHCHCSKCRKLHGSAYASYGAVFKDDFMWCQGRTSLITYRSSGTIVRMFCNTCGSMLISTDSTEPNIIYLSLGTTEGAIAMKPEYHQFVGSKASWYQITDDVAQYIEWPPE